MANIPSNTENSSDFDIVISGGGAVGSLLALALSQSNKTLKIAIVEAHDASANQTHPGFDARVIALSAHSTRYMQSLRMAESLKSIATPIKKIHVSDRGYLGWCELEHQDYGVPELGNVVALHDLGNIIAEAIPKDTLTRIQPDSIQDLEQTKDDVHISLQSGTKLQTKLLVVAEGGQSNTRKLLKLSASQAHYEQQAIIANLKLQAPHNNIAYERFTETGPLAMLPMSSDMMSMVWCVNPDDADEIMQLDDEDFLERVQVAFGQRLGKFLAASKRFTYPLILSQNESIQSHRAVFVGNAAQTLHPIAGQGFNLGLRDIECLVKALIASDDDPGAYDTLRQYRDLRTQDRAATINWTDGLVRLFSNQSLPLVMARNLGLFTMEHVPIFKRAFAQRAMGFTSSKQ